MMKRLLVIGHLSLVMSIAPAQSVRSLVNGGNDLYAEKKFTDAEVNYRKALEKDITSVPGHYDLGNSLYKQNKYDKSTKSYQDAAQKSETRSAKAQAYFNLGNAQLKSQKYDEAVKS
ncbi:MAG: tetratricopeptide repeat protein, partial [Bacteroidota bacterium]